MTKNLSHLLNNSEKYYSQLDKEAAAIIFGAKKFNQFLFGRHFSLSCDNKALCSIFGKKRDIPVFTASRPTRWSIIMNAYDYDIEYRASEKHGNADMLSRLPLKQSVPISTDESLYHIQLEHLPVDTEIIKSETEKDVTLKTVIKCLQRNTWSTTDKIDYKHCYLKRQELFIQDGILLWVLRVVIPKSLQQDVLKELHYQQPDIVRMKVLSRIHAWYPGIDKDIESLVEKCVHCKMVQNESPSCENHPWAWPSKSMDRIHLDYFGPYFGKIYLIMVDSYSKWCDVSIQKYTNAKKQLVLVGSGFQGTGCLTKLSPTMVHNSRHPILKYFARKMGLNTFEPHHQSSNGQSERFVQTIKKGLKKNDIENGDSQLKLDNYLFVYRTTPSSVTGKTPSESFMGRKLKYRLDCMKPDIATIENNFIKKIRHFSVGDKVVLRNFDSKEKWVPGTVIRKVSNLLYEIEVGSKIFTRHVDHILRNPTDMGIPKYDDYEYTSYDFRSDTGGDVRPPRSLRSKKTHPKRNRRPVDRYGMVPYA